MAPPAARPQRVLSGIQPTADAFHIGNYLGALREWVRMQDTHDAYYVVVDQHAITVEHDPQVLRRRTLLSFAQLLAVGLDPTRSTVSAVSLKTRQSWMPTQPPGSSHRRARSPGANAVSALAISQ